MKEKDFDKKKEWQTPTIKSSSIVGETKGGVGPNPDGVAYAGS